MAEEVGLASGPPPGSAAARPIRVVLSGVGGVGRNLVRMGRERPGFVTVAGYSRDPSLLGRDLGELAGIPTTGSRVLDKADAIAIGGDVLVIATTSFLRDVQADIHDGIEAGLDVICTAEEMADPWDVDAELAASIDAHARRRGVTVVGAGANPGYIYEVVGLALTGAIWRVDRIATRRVVDLSGFSAGVQRRLGIGFEPDEFEQLVRQHRIFGHIGFPHTIRAFARRMGVHVERVGETIEPILADRRITSSSVTVEVGRSAGLTQHTTGIVDGRPWYTADFVGHVEPATAGLTANDAYDIEGLPNVHAVVAPGFDPQWTAAGAIANFLPLVINARPGLLSVTELPIPTPWR